MSFWKASGLICARPWKPRSRLRASLIRPPKLLGLPIERREYDIMKGETRTPEFLATVNANGRIPVLQIGEGADARFLPESNAACFWLADGTHLVDAREQLDGVGMQRRAGRRQRKTRAHRVD